MEEVRVLIVDDELGMRLGAERVLRKVRARLPDLDLALSFQCVLEESGEGALDKLQGEPFDLLLLDYKLPDMTGLDVLTQLKLRGIDVVTVMMTAYASLETAVSAAKNGAFDFLAKPFSPEELESVMLKAARGLLASRQAKKLADEKRRVRFEFISVLAHELKSPLSAVESYLRLIKDRAAGERIDDYAQIVERSLLRLDSMRRLIFDLLDLTRIESGEKGRVLSPTDVGKVLKAAIENVEESAAVRGIEIHLDLDAPLVMAADPSEIQMICNNLVTNAVKYNRDGGRVDIDARMSNEILTLRVADTGIGISEEDRAFLFRSFHRIRNRETEHIQGSGLGLSILKRLVELYDGQINLDSEVDRGSTFTVTLQNKMP